MTLCDVKNAEAATGTDGIQGTENTTHEMTHANQSKQVISCHHESFQESAESHHTENEKALSVIAGQGFMKNGGERRIRTFVGLANGFTVRPL